MSVIDGSSFSSAASVAPRPVDRRAVDRPDKRFSESMPCTMAPSIRNALQITTRTVIIEMRPERDRDRELRPVLVQHEPRVR